MPGERRTYWNNMEHFFRLDKQDNEDAGWEEKICIEESTTSTNKFALRVPGDVLVWG